MIRFISLGPGDIEMVSLGTLRLLKEARKVYCFETNGVSRAADIIASLSDAYSSASDGIDLGKIVRIDIPMSKDRTIANKVYDELAETLRREAFTQEGLQGSFLTDCAGSADSSTTVPYRDYSGYRKYRDYSTAVGDGDILVATEGDSSIFATTHYVMDRLVAMGVECEQCPGVPSFIAAAALGGLHLVSQQQRLTIIPGKTSVEEIENLLFNGHNIVIMKLSMAHDVISQLIYFDKVLHKYRHNLQYHYFENVGTPQQEYRLLTETPDCFPYFSILVITQQ